MIPDPTDPSVSVGVVGAGVMGRGIAQIAAAAGCAVSLSDVSEDAARDALAFVSRMLMRQAEKGRTTRHEAEAAVARLRLAPALRDMRECTVVFEAVVEDLEVKRRLFAELGIGGVRNLRAGLQHIVVLDYRHRRRLRTGRTHRRRPFLQPRAVDEAGRSGGG